MIFPQTESPTFRKIHISKNQDLQLTNLTGRGFPATFGFVIAALISIVFIQYLAVRERHHQRNQPPFELFNENSGRDSKDVRNGKTGEVIELGLDYKHDSKGYQ